ncbi:MAG: hypothetical protein DMG38_04385 [Acidobacteria bacterium]|nr:MAG: hypothetical protein DMG38_04385 [Acidobacteriota bacterium]
MEKSATYKICGAAERRTVPIRELVENKAQRLKKKNSTRCTSRHPNQRENLPCALAAVQGQARWRGSQWSPLTAALAAGMCPP